MAKNKLLLFSCGQLSVLEKLQGDLFGEDLSGLKTVCITTAANPYGEQPQWQKDEMAIFEQFGLNLSVYDLEGKTSEETVTAFSDADIIYVTGGNTYFLLDHMKKTNCMDAIQQRLNDGALYIGCSAGAVVACANIDYIADMDDRSVTDLTDFSGLNLVDFYIIPHIDHEQYGAKAKKILNAAEYKDKVMLGLKDSQAAYINGKYFEIIE